MHRRSRRTMRQPEIINGRVIALASGVANACVVQERITHAHINPLSVSDPSWIRTTVVTHDESAPDHEEGARLSNAACLQVCDQGSQSLVKDPTHPDMNVPSAPFDATRWDVLPLVCDNIQRA